MNNFSNKISSEVTKLEREKEQLIEEESVLRKKISDKKREISTLKKRLKKVEIAKKTKKTEKTEKTRQNFEVKERNLPVSLRTLLFLPVIITTVVLSAIYANNLYPIADMGFLSVSYPLIIPFIIFSIGLVCFLASVFYFALYQLIQNYRRAK